MSRRDPVGERFYIPLSQAELVSNIAFYVATAFSVSVLLINKSQHKLFFEAAQTVFILSVLILFVSGIAIKLHFAPRSQSSRIDDFVSNAFSASLTHQPSVGYYNNTEADAIKRVAASLFENTFCSKSILERMLSRERLFVSAYSAAWIAAAVFRETDLELLGIAAQVVFSEQLLSRWLRMEWLRMRVERIYSDIDALFKSTSDFNGSEFRARTVGALLRYETGKSQAGISLSTRVFNRLNVQLSAEWEKIKATARIN